MEITEAAALLCPGTSWNLRGNTLEQAADGTPRVPVPTLAELQPLIDSDAYAEARRKAYPPIADQLDALWKGGETAAIMRAAIQAVKTKYPKPN